MRIDKTWSTSTLLLSCSLLALGACGDDSAGTGTTEGASGDTATSTVGTPTTTNESVDTTVGPMETTTDDPTTTGVDTTAGEESTTTGPPPGDADTFRFTSLVIRDPHFFDTLICSDITDTVNTQFADGIGMDGSDPPDGLLDLSLALVFRPADQGAGASGDVDFANADCTAPAETTECMLREGTVFNPTTFMNMDGICHEPDPTHLGGYMPLPGTTMGPCFVTAPADVVIVTAFDLPLSDAIIAAQYSGDDDLLQGTIRGFLSAADAEATILPKDLPVVGGNPISAILKGGAGSSILCSGDDTDGDGWWFYVDFVAERVPWSE